MNLVHTVQTEAAGEFALKDRLYAFIFSIVDYSEVAPLRVATDLLCRNRSWPVFCISPEGPRMFSRFHRQQNNTESQNR